MALREIDIHSGLHTPGFLVAWGARALASARESGDSLRMLTIGMMEPDCRSELPTDTFRTICTLIRENAGKNSLVARLGDKEIAVLIVGKDHDYAMDVVRSIIDSIEDAGIKPSDGVGGFSFGIASTSDGIKDIGGLIKASHIAMIHGVRN